MAVNGVCILGVIIVHIKDKSAQVYALYINYTWLNQEAALSWETAVRFVIYTSMNDTESTAMQSYNSIWLFSINRRYSSFCTLPSQNTFQL